MIRYVLLTSLHPGFLPTRLIPFLTRPVPTKRRINHNLHILKPLFKVTSLATEPRQRRTPRQLGAPTRACGRSNPTVRSLGDKVASSGTLNPEAPRGWGAKSNCCEGSILGFVTNDLPNETDRQGPKGEWPMLGSLHRLGSSLPTAPPDHRPRQRLQPYPDWINRVSPTRPAPSHDGRYPDREGGGRCRG